MRPVYKQSDLGFLAFSFVCLLCLWPAGHATAEDSVFTVSGVHVDVTAENAVAAREAAFDQAQSKAFAALAARLLPDDEAASLTPPGTDVISDLVQDFEITEERLSSVRYVGTYTFRFKNDAVRNYFSGTGLSYTDVESKAVLILPFYQWGDRTILWDENNPWRRTWTRSSHGDQGLVPVVVPIGDLADVTALDGSDMLGYAPLGLADMTDRYGAREAIIVLATPSWDQTTGPTLANTPPAALEVVLYRTDRGRPEKVQTLHVTARNGEADDLFDKAVRSVRKALQKDWKSRTVVTAAEGNDLTVRVRFQSMREWVETQKALQSVQGIGSVTLLSLTPREARISLSFRGDEERLRLALAQADMTLTTPNVAFSNLSGYGASPLVYDLYLNKYAPGLAQP